MLAACHSRQGAVKLARMFFRLPRLSGFAQRSRDWRARSRLVVLLVLISVLPAYATELRNFRPRGTNLDITVPVEWMPVDAGTDPDRIQLAFQVRNPASADNTLAANVGVVIFAGAAMATFRKTRGEATLDNTRFPGYVELEHSANDSEEAIRYQIRKGGKTTVIRENFLWNADTGIVVVAIAPDLAAASAEWKQDYARGIDILLGSLRRSIAPKP
jgi:hypothetical protein